MRVFLVSLLLISFIECNSSDSNEIFNDQEWVDVLSSAISFSKISSDTNLIYFKYENEDVRKHLEALYRYGSDIFGYKIQDSVLFSIKEKKNRVISSKIDTIELLHIKFISDTVCFSNKYLMISEPSFIDKDKVMFSLTEKRRDGTTKRWVYFVQKKEYYRLIAIYDFQKDQMYGATKL